MGGKRKNLRALTLIETILMLVILSIVGVAAGVGLQAAARVPAANDRALAVQAELNSEMDYWRAVSFGPAPWPAAYPYSKTDTVTLSYGGRTAAVSRTVTIKLWDPNSVATNATAGKIYSGSDIKADEKMITHFYGARGYADATVETQLLEVRRGLMRTTYDITERKKSLFQAIQISGNAKVKEEDIRKEFKLASGDVFNTALIEQGRQALLKTGLFETVEVSTLEAKPGYKNLEVTVVEK